MTIHLFNPVIDRRQKAGIPFRLTALFGLLAAVCLPANAAPAGNSPSRVFDVRQFGAKGDGQTLDTAAIQAALDACGKAGGGVVRFTAGKYLSRPIVLRNKSTLQLDAKAVLLATDEEDHFLRPDRKDQPRSNSSFVPFISGIDLTDIAITGQGTIDGAGARWWGPAEEARRKTPGYTLPRPRLIVLTRCKNVKVTGVTLANSPTFHFVPTDCEDVTVDGVTITAPSGSPNTDGIDPSVSRRVLITRCRIDVGDDNIAIKSGRKMPGREFACEDITVTNCVFLHGHGLSIGSETVGGVRNLLVRDCTFEGTEYGLRIKSPRGRGGMIENITYSDIRMTNVDPAITITCYYPRIPEQDTKPEVTTNTPTFRNLRFTNITATSPKEAGVIVGLPESAITNVVLENVRLTANTGLTVRNARAVRFKNVDIKVQSGDPVIIRNAEVSGWPPKRQGAP